mgnify:CR=1 FL=1|tara:strand:- start:2458 stop:3126 length:669 start_codon:yes stop_codon:yes gene_type:complete
MEHKFWHERWAKSEIGFHLSEVNSLLIRYWSTLQAISNDTIFVPLCGKSKDLIWLAERVKQVIGVELSQTAVSDFFSENGLKPTITQGEFFIEYRHANITLLCGDFFQLTQAEVINCDLVYDRASLIAFPPEMRPVYIEKLNGLLTEEKRRLLITIEYPQNEMNGPPFSVPADEIERLLSQEHRIECLESKDIIDASPRFKNKGVSAMSEHVFLLQRKTICQ